MIFPGTKLYELAKEKGFIDDTFWLTDYAWKVYTAENSRLWLNIFGNALENRRRLSKNFIVNLINNHRFISKEIELRFKELLARIGLRKQKIGKYRIAY